MKNLPWTNYLIEFVTVVLGILLAFGLNTYYNNLKEEERVSHFLEGVHLEIEENAAEVNEKLTYHKGILKELSSNPEKVILRLKAPRVKKYAWQIAQDNSISQHIPYELYKQLAEIYAVQRVLDQNSSEASIMMSHLNVLSPFYIVGVDVGEEEAHEFAKNVKSGWKPIFEDFITSEEELIELYNEVLIKF
ncbi:MAG: hypothetical protein ABJF04_08890 [Reichenbachiella sp.]|uniref:hypothetical protein n=1 Tax=Reichenbachiella sp. TaxID=2184521 RepID=UPI003267D005